LSDISSVAQQMRHGRRLTWGGMTFFSTVMAPFVFTKLPLETAGPFIRAVFSWYYLAIG